MFVGEQPGDQEDREGHPFVGPAGKILHSAMHDAGIDESEIYVTNVVKHFKWSPAERGKRRIHKKPRYSEIHACRPWLDAELRVVRPQVLVCLGASAAQSLLGKRFQCQPPARAIRRIIARPDRDGNSTSFVHFACTR